MVRLPLKAVLLFTLLAVFFTFPSVGVAENYDLHGKIVEGRFLVPMRAIFENLGAQVGWDASTRTVTGFKDNVSITLKIDDKNAFVDGKKYELDVAAQIINGRTFVPIRFISESLGADVNWDAGNQTATIVLGETVLKVRENEQDSGPDQKLPCTLTVEYKGTGFGLTDPPYGNHQYEKETTVEIKQDFSWADPYSYLEYWETDGHYIDAIEEPVIYIVMDSDKKVIAHWHFCP